MNRATTKAEGRDGVEPIHGHEFITVSSDGLFNQILCFDYHDPLSHYESLLEDERRYNEEMSSLCAAMQAFLDEETVKVNGQRCTPRVLTASLDFRGSENLPCITFFAQFRAPLKPGLNVYECRYSEEIVEYDYEVYWLFPPGTEVVSVEAATEQEIVGGNVVIIWARAGDRSGASERITFKLPEDPSKASR